MPLPKSPRPQPLSHKAVQKGIELAVAVAAQVRDATLRRAQEMDRAEARGYIRAKATPIIHRQFLLYRPQLAEFDAETLSALALDVSERVVRLVVDDAVHARVHSRRRAA